MTGTSNQPSNTHDDSPQLVPESWPPAEPIEPVKPRRIHWLLALPATIPAMLMPRRIGPHLASSSWAAAYVVHILSALITFGATFAFGIEQGNASGEYVEFAILVNPLVELRRALAGAVLFFYGALNGWAEVLVALLVTAVIEAAMWVAPLVLIPLHAAGEGPRRTYLRSVKLLLWSSACQIPVFWLFMRLMGRFELYEYEAWAFATLLLLELWWFSVLIRLGGRYAGPKEGPRWQERSPRCERCGYSLISLPLTGRCPECGDAVYYSLPERRSPPAFAVACGLSGRLRGFVGTTWQVMFGRHLGEEVAIWSRHRAARNYAFLVCLLIGLIAAATALVANWQYNVLGGNRWPEWLSADDRTIGLFLRCFEPLAAAVAIGIGAGVGGLALMLLVGLILSWFGFRDVARRVVVLCYSPALLLSPLLLGIMGYWAAYAIIDEWGPLGSWYISGVGQIDYDLAVGFASLLPGVFALWLSSRRLRSVLRQTRFANA